MKVATVIGTIKTQLEALTWTSDSGTGTTKFNGVFTYNNYSHEEGYPFACINDISQQGESLTNRHVSAMTRITVSVCVNYAIIDKVTDDERMEEGSLRIREASDVLKSTLLGYTFMNAIGADFIVDWEYSDIEVVEDLNLLKREFSFNIKEVIAR